MVEHRLIERIIRMIASEKQRLGKGGGVDALFLDKVVDFIRVYADRTHHGKEEDILFADLQGRPLSGEERASMQELVEEHRQARNLTKDLVAAKDAYLAGNTDELPQIVELLQKLVDLYPQHIKKEDSIFFPKTERHYTDAELDQMLRQFYDFDMRMIHEKYYDTVEVMEQERQ